MSLCRLDIIAIVAELFEGFEGKKLEEKKKKKKMGTGRIRWVLFFPPGSGEMDPVRSNDSSISGILWVMDLALSSFH